MLTHQERDRASSFIAALYTELRRRIRRKPKDHEIVVAAYGHAVTIMSATQSRERPRGLARPVVARIAAPDVMGPVAYSAAQVTTAGCVLRYLDEIGDRRSNDPRAIAGNALDRRILRELADEYSRPDCVNESRVARKVGRSHTTVRDRKLARCCRIMAAIRDEFPEKFTGHRSHVAGVPSIKAA